MGLRDWVDLPPGYNPRTLQWAADLRARPELQTAGTAELVAAVLRHIRTGGFSYTLEPGPYGRDAIDEFWFDRQLGFCEHFAAAFVVVMRAMDVPARIVTGYQGTDPLPVDGYWIVRQSNAHAWAEVWQAGAAGCASTRPRRWRPTASAARAQPDAAAGAGGRRHRQRQPGLGSADARRPGSWSTTAGTSG